jgi:hypothetical protein
MNENQQTIAKAGNPSIKYPPNSTQSIPFSRPNVGYQGSPLVDSWAEAPSDGTYVLGSVGGQIQWIATENCT